MKNASGKRPSKFNRKLGMTTTPTNAHQCMTVYYIIDTYTSYMFRPHVAETCVHFLLSTSNLVAQCTDMDHLTFSRLMTYIYMRVCVCVCVCRTAPLTSRCCTLYIYSTNIRTEYFKHAAHSPFFPLQNAVYFIMLPFLVPVFYIQKI